MWFDARICQHSIEVLGLCEVGGTKVKIPVELLKRYEEVLLEFNEVQKDFGLLIKEVKGGSDV